MNIRQKNSPWLIPGVICLAILLNTLYLPQTTTMAQSLPMQDQISTIVRRQAKAWSEGNVQAIAEDFAEDAMFIAAGFKLQGKPEIKRVAEDYFRQFEHIAVEIKRIISSGNQGAVEWQWQEQNRQTGIKGYAEDAIILELKNNKIVYWREYIEKKK